MQVGVNLGECLRVPLGATDCNRPFFVCVCSSLKRPQRPQRSQRTQERQRILRVSTPRILFESKSKHEKRRTEFLECFTLRCLFIFPQHFEFKILSMFYKSPSKRERSLGFCPCFDICLSIMCQTTKYISQMKLPFLACLFGLSEKLKTNMPALARRRHFLNLSFYSAITSLYQI